MGVKESMVEDRSVESIRDAIDRGIGRLARKVAFGNLPVKQNKIVFMTYRNAYECNPKYIAEKILEMDLPLDLVWVVPKKGVVQEDAFPKGIRLVRRECYEGYFEMATAKVWIDNSLNFMWQPFPKKREQVYIETWHGSMGLKRVGKDDVQDKRWLKAAKRVTDSCDYCISDSLFENRVYRETHWPDTEIWAFGHPRNDILFEQDIEELAALKRKVAKTLDFTEDDRLMLYAPTFRDSGSLDCFDVDFERLIPALEKRFGGNWKILSRMHFHDRRKMLAAVQNNDLIIDATQYPDIQELLAVADAGLTDYSSWACDYVLTGKPLFIYAPDLDEYNNERGLYYPLETTPFPIAEDNDRLIANVNGFDAGAYARKSLQFIDDRGCFEDGCAAERVVNKLMEITGIR